MLFGVEKHKEYCENNKIIVFYIYIHFMYNCILNIFIYAKTKSIIASH